MQQTEPISRNSQSAAAAARRGTGSSSAMPQKLPPLGGDPRVGGVVHPYKKPGTEGVEDDKKPAAAAEGGDATTDLLCLGATVLGVLASTMRWKMASWAAVFCTCAAFTNMRASESDFKQLMSGAGMAIMSLLANYLMPQAPGAGAPKTRGPVPIED